MSRKEPEVGAMPRAYINYDFVRLTKAVPAAPPNARTLDAFLGKEYLFFIDRGMFCVECRKSGIVLDFPPSQVHFGQRTREEVAKS